jgi:hypothetical protein
MEDRRAHVCSDCRTRAPETDTNYTLISSRYGWRLTRKVAADGTFSVEWRCPRCWERHKQSKMMSMTPRDGVPVAIDLRASRPGRDVGREASGSDRPGAGSSPPRPPTKRTSRPPAKRR